ncbi:lipopolysaccharide assembly protein LapB [Nocardiopsis sp. CNS-639]|uniref:tetratricopeptide repeat protein n=1 Tax=Nocardiopsis sp. CNS-639 TaxID=1169153 RepID=UPI0003A9DC2B|nr:hypothetical protein [Nocardiopsis sp. CNS-639]
MPATTPSSLRELAQRLQGQGELVEAEHVLQQAEHLLASTGDRAARAQVHEELGVLALHRGDTALAQKRFLRVLDTAGDVGWEERVWRVRRRMGEVALAVGNHAKAVTDLTAAWDRATDYQDLDQIVGISAPLTRALLAVGETDRARQVVEIALPHAQRQHLDAHVEELCALQPLTLGGDRCG